MTERLRTALLLSFVCLFSVSCASPTSMLHPGLLLQPQFDEVLLFHLPTQIGEHYNPYEGKALPGEHFVKRPIYSPINRKLQQDIANVLDDEPSSLHCHAGNWINKHPDDIPNLELEPIGYSRRWLGEERMGGGWSSDMCPLSGDRSGGSYARHDSLR